MIFAELNELILEIGSFGMQEWHLPTVAHAYIVVGWTLLTAVSVFIAFRIQSSFFLVGGWLIPCVTAFLSAIYALAVQSIDGTLYTHVAKDIAGTMGVCTMSASAVLVLALFIVSFRVYLEVHNN